MKKKKAIIIIALVVLLPGVLYGGYMRFFSGHYVNVKGQKLNQYTCSSGRGMEGGYSRMTVVRYDEKTALLSYERARQHNEEPEVSKYSADVKILDAIQKVFTENKMNHWNNKKFTKMLIADGTSQSYSFTFDSKRVSFSSRHYPKEYWDKIALIDDAMKPYIEKAKSLSEPTEPLD